MAIKYHCTPEGYNGKHNTSRDMSFSLWATDTRAGKVSGLQKPKLPSAGNSRDKGFQEQARAGPRAWGPAGGKAESNVGPCPVCKERHTYQRRFPWGYLQWPSDWLRECKTFQAPSPPQRSKVIKEQRGCIVCTSWAHNQERCNKVRQYIEGGPEIGCQQREGAEVCGQPHHRMLHEANPCRTPAKQ